MVLMIRLRKILPEQYQVDNSVKFVDAHDVYETLNKFNKNEMKSLFDELQKVMSTDPMIRTKFDKISRRFSHDWARFYAEVLELFTPKA